MRLNRSLTALLSLVALVACEENAVRDLTGPLPGAQVKFYNHSVGAPAVHFYAGDRKMTATTSALCQAAQDPPVTANDTVCVTIGREATGGVGYGDVGSGGLYVGIEPGQYALTGRTVGASGGTAVGSVTSTLQDGKSYSYYLSGIYNATSGSDAFIVEDNFPATIDWSVATVRFVNAIGNSQPMTLYATNVETGQEYAIGGTVAYRSAGAFTQVPPGTYDLAARVEGSTTDRIIREDTPFEEGRVYTITARGDMTVTSTTAATRPFLDLTRNR